MIDMKKVSNYRKLMVEMILLINDAADHYSVVLDDEESITLEELISGFKNGLEKGFFKADKLKREIMSTEELAAFVMQCKLFGVPDIKIDTEESYVNSQGIWLQFKP